MKFRKKPVVIEAEMFDPSIHTNVVRFDEVLVKYFIRTREGKMFIKPGDWIIKGIKGEYYPCKPDIFEATYEKVEE